MRNINKYLSSKIKIVSFIAIVMVVYAHCYNYTDSYLQPTTTITEGINYGTFIEYFICNGVTRVSIPLFFIMSGYLFFLKCDFSVSKYIYKLKSRFVSLVIPYVIWTGLALLFIWLLRGVGTPQINSVKETYNNIGISELILWDPPCYQMWYVRQLIIYVIMSPLFYIILKNNFLSLIYFVVTSVIWFTNADIDLRILNTEGILFFAVGSYLALHKRQDIVMKEKSKNSMITFFVLWILLLIIKTIMSGVGIEGSVSNALYKVSQLVGTYAIWYGIDHVLKNESIKDKLLSISAYTFFIFCFHEPYLNFVLEYSIINITNSTLGLFVCFLLYANGAIIISILVGKLLEKYAGGLYNVLCGNRGSKKKELKVSNSKSIN